MKAVGSVANKRCTVERSICLFFSCETETIKRKTKLEIRIVQEGKKFLHFLGFFSSSFAGSVFYKKHSRKTKPNHSSFFVHLRIMGTFDCCIGIDYHLCGWTWSNGP